jgi:transposase
VKLGETLHAWRQQIAAMRRFTRNNGITEGFRNFENYRLGVKVLCG